MNALVLYASQKGSTAEIAHHIASLMTQLGVVATVYNVAQPVDLEQPFDAVILATPIYKGIWLPDMTRFVRASSQLIGDKPVWAIFPCIRLLEKNGDMYANNRYIPTKMLSRFNVQSIKFVTGKLLKSDMTTEDMLVLSARYDGESLASISGDYRDWDVIDRWTHDIVLQLKRTRVLS